MPCPLPRRIKWVHMSMTSPLTRPSPNGRRVGIRIVTFEACSGFTLVTAHRIAQPPKATFVTRLQPSQLPNQAARQLPDLSTSIRVDPSSTGNSRRRGALPVPDIKDQLQIASGIRIGESPALNDWQVSVALSSKRPKLPCQLGSILLPTDCLPTRGR